MRNLVKPSRASRLAALVVVSAAALAGCGGAGANFEFAGNPFYWVGGNSTGTTGPGSSTRSSGSGFTSGTQGSTDPCDETQARKFVRISMRNTSSDYVHYFLILVALVNSDTYPEGAVCSTETSLYTAFGYISVPAGTQRVIGNYCLTGPLLYYIHRGGQFQSSGTLGLASAIGPAQGATATYDTFFTAGGQQVPVPNWILFHNPGSTAEGAALKVSFNSTDPCNTTVLGGESQCLQDAFYYVDENDIASGSSTLGSGSYRRVPSEIQGTGCQCGISGDAYASLAASSATSIDAACDEFLRGGRIEFAFVRSDTEPPFPQLVWRVTDSNGSRAHDFDPRAGLN